MACRAFPFHGDRISRCQASIAAGFGHPLPDIWLMRPAHEVDDMKAYVVSDDEYCTIEFAEHRATAQARGANELNTEFTCVTCRRAPEFDAWAERGKVPWRVLIEDHGWSQECGGCYRRVYADEPDRVYGDDHAFCSEACKTKRAEYVEKITAQYQQVAP